MTDPTEALDAIEQALQGIWTDVDTEEHYKTVPRVTEALTHIATLRQQVAYQATRERYIDKLRQSLDDIIKNDSTHYNHHQPRQFDGRTPKEDGGTIWLTPKEIARRALRTPRPNHPETAADGGQGA